MPPDISMCINDKCHKASECHRVHAEPDPDWQSYADFDYERDKCFIKMRLKGINSSPGDRPRKPLK